MKLSEKWKQRRDFALRILFGIGNLDEGDAVSRAYNTPSGRRTIARIILYTKAESWLLRRNMKTLAKIVFFCDNLTEGCYWYDFKCWLSEKVWGEEWGWEEDWNPFVSPKLRTEGWFWRKHIRNHRNTKPRPLRRNLHQWKEVTYDVR